MILLLDASALSAVMHRVPGALRRLGRFDPWSVVLCAPVAAEVHYGLANLPADSRRRQLLENEYQLIRSVARWVDWDEGSARRFGVLKAALGKAGTAIHDLDIAVSSIALTLGATVATRDPRHFEKIEGLPVEAWAEL